MVNNNVQFHSVQSKHLKHDTHYDSIQYTFEYVFIVITLEIFCNYDTLHWWNMEQIAQLSLAHCLPRYLSFIHSDILVNIIFHFKKQKCGDVPYSFRDSWNQRLNLRNFYRYVVDLHEKESIISFVTAFYYLFSVSFNFLFSFTAPTTVYRLPYLMNVEMSLNIIAG